MIFDGDPFSWKKWSEPQLSHDFNTV